MSSLVFLELKVRLLSAHHATRCWTSSPLADSFFVVDEANHCCVICKLNIGTGTMYRCAVVGEEGVEERTQHVALWGSNGILTQVFLLLLQHDGGGFEACGDNCLGQ